MALSTIPTRALSEQGINFRNLIINGDMSIAQRSTSETGITSSSYYTVDRYRTAIDLSGTWTQSQSTDVPTGQGFANSLKMDCTTANASLSSNSVLFLNQRFEGQMVQYLKKGTSNAESLTLSFWVKSNKTGTYIAELFDIDNLRQISKSYTISSANTWEKKTITFAGDTTGALDNDNARSIDINLFLTAGTNYTSGTLGTSWQSYDDTDRAVGQVNLADSTSNEWYITGVQLEVGTTASDFEFLPYDVNIHRCERYFRIVTSAFGTVYASNAVRFSPSFDEMRSTPSVSGTDNILFTNNVTDFSLFSGASYSLFNSDKYGGRLQISGWSGLTAGNVAQLLPTGTGAGQVYFDAEL